MGRRYRRNDGGEVRRMVMAAWCRVRMGDDAWSEGWAEMLAYGVLLLLLLMFGLGFLLGGTARGDVIVWVESVDRRVYAGSALVIELPHEIGYITFGQAETYAGVDESGLAFMGVGPAWAGGLIGTGIPLGSISLQVVDIFVQGWSRVVWDQFGRQVGHSEQAAADGVLWGGGGSLPDWIAGDGDPDWSEQSVLVPFQWERFAVPGVREAVSGSGWVSLDSVSQMVPVVDPVTGVQWITGSGYTVRTVVLAQDDRRLRSGELPDGWSGGGASGGGVSGNGGTAVPEPGGIAGMLAAAAVAAAWGVWTRRRMQGQECGQEQADTNRQATNTGRTE